jgi:outer membrane protein OmpA-like peptidoglycan-associated protein
MNRMFVIALGLLLLALPAVLVVSWIGSAKDRLAAIDASGEGQAQEVAVAAAANEKYCTPDLQKILRRVLQSCGLIGSGGGRGCQPLEAKQVATMSGSDFNALFTPMAGRGGIVQYQKDSDVLDQPARELIDKVYADRRGASYFLVVARASPEGAVAYNRELSRKRAEAVMSHLSSTFEDPELERQVGLLWLGMEYAQLEQEFCGWQRSGPDHSCTKDDLNRSAFITWIDCRL